MASGPIYHFYYTDDHCKYAKMCKTPAAFLKLRGFVAMDLNIPWVMHAHLQICLLSMVSFQLKPGSHRKECKRLHASDRLR